MLAGTAVRIALPTLDAMLNLGGTAYGQTGQPIPKRFGLFFWGNGIKPARWTPAATGTAYAATDELRPLVDAGSVLRPYIAVLTGLQMKVAPAHPHHSGCAGILTGSTFQKVADVRDTISSTFAGPSIDQVVAKAWEGKTPFRSIEIGLSPKTGSDEGTTFLCVSHNGPNSINEAERDPAKLFARLFAKPPPNGVPAGPDPLVASRLSLLDTVKEDLSSLNSKLGPKDKARLDQHLSSLQTLEQRLKKQQEQGTAAPVPGCTTPAQPGAVGLNGEDVLQRTALMAELLKMALVCDLTRVFSITFNQCGGQNVFRQVTGATEQHSMSHNEAQPQTHLHDTIVFAMQNLANVLTTLHGAAEGGGNLLDSLAMLGTSEHSDGSTHSYNEFPLLVVGKAQGALKVGHHYRSAQENTSLVLLSLLRASGLNLPSFGTGGGAVTSGLAAIGP